MQLGNTKKKEKE